MTRPPFEEHQQPGSASAEPAASGYLRKPGSARTTCPTLLLFNGCGHTDRSSRTFASPRQRGSHNAGADAKTGLAGRARISWISPVPGLGAGRDRCRRNAHVEATGIAGNERRSPVASLVARPVVDPAIGRRLGGKLLPVAVVNAIRSVCCGSPGSDWSRLRWR